MKFYTATPSTGGTQPAGQPTWPIPAPTPLPPGYGTYTEYVALITQTSTDAPTATILFNNIEDSGSTADIIWTYSNVGKYIATLPFISDTDKTLPLISVNITSSPLLNTIKYGFRYNGDGTFNLWVYGGGVLSDGLLANTPIIIRIYT